MGRCLPPLPGDTKEKTYEAGIWGNEQHQYKDTGHPECGFLEVYSMSSWKWDQYLEAGRRYGDDLAEGLDVCT